MEGQRDGELPQQPTQQPELEKDDARVWSEARPWPVRALTFMLAVQGAAVLALSLWQMDEWPSAFARWSEPDVAFYLPLPFLALLGFIAVFGFIWLRPGAWVMAMLVQGLYLIFTLAFYFFFDHEDFFLFAMMFYAIVMVLYLNYAEVPAVFRVAPGQETDGV